MCLDAEDMARRSLQNENWTTTTLRKHNFGKKHKSKLENTYTIVKSAKFHPI